MSAPRVANILILDHDLKSRARTVKVVEALGHQIYQAGTRQEAIRKMEKTRINILLTNITLPDGGGLELISQLRAQATTRSVSVVVLSDAADRFIVAAAIRAGAQAFIIKGQISSKILAAKIDKLLGCAPEENDTLQAEKISEPESKTQGLPDKPLVSNVAIERMFKKERGVKALAFTVRRVGALARSRSSTAQDLAAALENDPALSIRVLRVANSAFYGSGRVMDSIQLAIVKLGFQEIARIALSVSVIDLIEGKNKNGGYNRLGLWEHSLTVAILARALAVHSELVSPDEAYLAGLVHDISRFVLDDYFPEQMELAVEWVDEHQISMNQAEELIFGFNHQEIGRRLGVQWHMNSEMTHMLSLHHAPMAELVGDGHNANTLTAVVKLADSLSKIGGVGTAGDDFLEEVDFEACETLGMNRQVISEALHEVEDEVKQAMQALAVTTSASESELVLSDMPGQVKIPGNPLVHIYGAPLQVHMMEMLLGQIGCSAEGFEANAYACEDAEHSNLIIFIAKTEDQMKWFRSLLEEQCPLCQAEHAFPPFLFLTEFPNANSLLEEIQNRTCQVMNRPWSVKEFRETVQELIQTGQKSTTP